MQNHSLKLKIEECLLNKKRIVKYISFKYINFQGGANKFWILNYGFSFLVLNF